MSFCAICTDTIVGKVHREPLGKNDALVNVCASCSTQPARHVHGVERGYEIDEGISQKDLCAIVQPKLTAMRPVAEHLASFGRNETATSKTPGYLIVRVRRFAHGGKSRDSREAFEQELKHQPWAAEVRYIATDQRWHIYERPDPKLTTRPPSSNPLMWIEQYRVKEN